MSAQDTRRVIHCVTQGWGSVTAFAVVAPTLGILIARFVSPLAGPAVASAGSSHRSAEAESSLQSAPTHTFRPLSQSDRAELQMMAQGDSQINGTPLMKLAGEPSGAVVRAQEVIETQPTVTPPPLGLTSIMTSKGLPLAVVGGQLRRVGDEVCPGWSVGAIDADAGTVTLLHESGLEHTVKLRE